MPNSEYQHAARLTIELVRHTHAPDELTDVILETLIEMAHESKINIWLMDFGLSPSGLTQLYSKHKTGAGRERALMYANYEIGREKDDT